MDFMEGPDFYYTKVTISISGIYKLVQAWSHCVSHSPYRDLLRPIIENAVTQIKDAPDQTQADDRGRSFLFFVFSNFATHYDSKHKDEYLAEAVDLTLCNQLTRQLKHQLTNSQIDQIRELWNNLAPFAQIEEPVGDDYWYTFDDDGLADDIQCADIANTLKCDFNI